MRFGPSHLNLASKLRFVLLLVISSQLDFGLATQGTELDDELIAHGLDDEKADDYNDLFDTDLVRALRGSCTLGVLTVDHTNQNCSFHPSTRILMGKVREDIAADGTSSLFKRALGRCPRCHALSVDPASNLCLRCSRFAGSSVQRPSGIVLRPPLDFYVQSDPGRMLSMLSHAAIELGHVPPPPNYPTQPVEETRLHPQPHIRPSHPLLLAPLYIPVNVHSRPVQTHQTAFRSPDQLVMTRPLSVGGQPRHPNQPPPRRSPSVPLPRPRPMLTFQHAPRSTHQGTHLKSSTYPFERHPAPVPPGATPRGQSGRASDRSRETQARVHGGRGSAGNYRLAESNRGRGGRKGEHDRAVSRGGGRRRGMGGDGRQGGRGVSRLTRDSRRKRGAGAGRACCNSTPMR